MHSHHHHDIEAIQGTRAELAVAIQNHIASIFGEGMYVRDFVGFAESISSDDVDAEPTLLVFMSASASQHFLRGAGQVGVMILDEMTSPDD